MTGTIGKALVCVMLLAMGTEVVAADEPLPASVPGWNVFVDDLRTLPERLLAKLPASMRNDPQIQQEVARLALASLAGNVLETIGGDGDHPVFLPNQNLVLDLPMPNADTTYRVARITPGGAYRLRGRRGSLRMLYLSQIGGPPASRAMLDMNALHIDAAGRFDLIISPQRPATHGGDWWPLQPGTDRLLLRMVAADWQNEVDPTIAVERIDHAPQRPRVSAADLEARLRALPSAVSLLPLMFVARTEALAGEGYVNRMKAIDLSNAGGMSGQAYFDGVYDLGPDDALLMEVRVPASCHYYSLILGNQLHETTDWINNHSSLNDAQARIDADGVLRVIVSASDPGVTNWLDTAGYPRGLLQARWICDEPTSTPSLRKLTQSALSAALPHDTVRVTPAQREAAVRARRLAAQQRPLW